MPESFAYTVENPASVMARVEHQWRGLAHQVYCMLQDMTPQHQELYWKKWSEWMAMPKEGPAYNKMLLENAKSNSPKKTKKNESK